MVLNLTVTPLKPSRVASSPSVVRENFSRTTEVLETRTARNARAWTTTRPACTTRWPPWTVKHPHRHNWPGSSAKKKPPTVNHPRNPAQHDTGSATPTPTHNSTPPKWPNHPAPATTPASPTNAEAATTSSPNRHQSPETSQLTGASTAIMPEPRLGAAGHRDGGVVGWQRSTVWSGSTCWPVAVSPSRSKRQNVSRQGEITFRTRTLGLQMGRRPLHPDSPRAPHIPRAPRPLTSVKSHQSPCVIQQRTCRSGNP